MTKGKHLVRKPSREYFEETLVKITEVFLGLTYDLSLTSRALHLSNENPNLVDATTPIRLLSMIYKGQEYTVDNDDLKSFAKKLSDPQFLSTKNFLLHYLAAEFFLSSLPPKREPWGFNCSFEKPEFWFSNMSFDDFVELNTACMWEINRTRNDLVHNKGLISEDTVKVRSLRYENLGKSLDNLEPYRNVFFKNHISMRLLLKKGDIVPIDLDYLGFTQMTLLERIFLKSGMYHYFFSKKGKETQVKKEFIFKVFGEWN